MAGEQVQWTCESDERRSGARPEPAGPARLLRIRSGLPVALAAPARNTSTAMGRCANSAVLCTRTVASVVIFARYDTSGRLGAC